MLFDCPLCHGRPISEPGYIYADPTCGMCDGEGKIDTDNVCRCGRPAVVYVGEVLCCLSPLCHKRAAENPKHDTSHADAGWWFNQTEDHWNNMI